MSETLETAREVELKLSRRVAGVNRTVTILAPNSFTRVVEWVGDPAIAADCLIEGIHTKAKADFKAHSMEGDLDAWAEQWRPTAQSRYRKRLEALASELLALPERERTRVLKHLESRLTADGS